MSLDSNINIDDTYFCNIVSNKVSKHDLESHPHCISSFCNVKHTYPCDIGNKVSNMGICYERSYERDSWIKDDRSTLNGKNIDPTLKDTFDFYNDKSSICETTKQLDEKVLKVNKKRKKLGMQPLKYIPGGQSIRTVSHLGQLKLFLSTLQFLTDHVDPTSKIPTYIIYPGAARGDNILLLADMFPTCIWYLYDKNPFNVELYKRPGINIVNDFLYRNGAIKLAEDIRAKHKNQDPSILLISDIRRYADEYMIIQDNALQEQWCRDIRPTAAQLKFRMPRLSTKYTYLSGDIFIQMFAPKSSTEVRLVVKKDAPLVSYDVGHHEARMMYFNRVLRPKCYDPIQKNDHLDGCHDCVLMRRELDKYRRKHSSIARKYWRKYGNRGDKKRADDSLKYFISDPVSWVLDNLQNMRKRVVDGMRNIRNAILVKGDVIGKSSILKRYYRRNNYKLKLKSFLQSGSDNIITIKDPSRFPTKFILKTDNNILDYIDQYERIYHSIKSELESRTTYDNKYIHQDIVAKYLSNHTPFRGLILYHGLGSGKTSRYS